MPIDEYWMGKNIDVDRIWADYDEGHGYVEKVASANNYLLRLTFSGHPTELPLFDHEAIFKSVKSAFHDIKAECMPADIYNQTTPIFLYRVDRGSGIYEFLAEFRGLITFVGGLAAASMWYRSAMQKDQDLDEKRWRFIAAEFPQATVDDRLAYLKACTTWGRRRVLQRLNVLSVSAR
jgi:hypothetical protein